MTARAAARFFPCLALPRAIRSIQHTRRASAARRAHFGGFFDKTSYAPHSAATLGAEKRGLAQAQRGTSGDAPVPVSSAPGPPASLPAKYSDTPGFCKSATLDDIRAHNLILTPGRYVGAAEVEDDGEPFEEKMARLTKELKSQMEEATKLDKQIWENLEGVGYGG